MRPGLLTPIPPDSNYPRLYYQLLMGNLALLKYFIIKKPISLNNFE